MNFGRVLTAMVTPFDEQLKVDVNRLQALVRHLIENGTDTIVVAGTTGESPTLSKKEKIDLLKEVKSIAGNKVKIIMNVGSNNTQDSIEFAKEVEATGAADGIMLVNPYYNKPSQEGLYHHFSTIAANTKLPIMLYNIPGRTSVNLQASTTIELAKIPNIVAVKESSGDLSQMATIIQGTHENFALYSGDDNLTLPILAIGGNGVVSVASHLAGNEMQKMIQFYLDGNVEKASALHRELLPFFEGIFFQTNPVPIKKALTLSGIPVGGVRLPLMDMKKEDEKVVKQLLANLPVSKK